MMGPDVSMKLVIITVNYCCAAEILARLDQTLNRLNEIGGEYWIVDNHSPDNSLKELQHGVAQNPNRHLVQILPSDHNGGFGYGNNLAIRRALATDPVPDYLYFLNPDALPRPGALAALRDFLNANPGTGIAGSLLCDKEDQIQTSFFRFPSFFSELEQAIAFRPVSALLRRHLVALETPDSPIPVDWVAGTSFMARTEIFDQVGLFDENFFLYWEETELCHRIKTAGFEIYGIPTAAVEHVGGVTTGLHDPDRRIPAYWYASRNYFFRKTGQVRNIMLMNILVLAGLVFWRLHHMLRRRQLDNPHFVRDFIRYSFRRIPTARTDHS